MYGSYLLESAARDNYGIRDEIDELVGFRVARTIAVVPFPAD